MGLPGTLVGPYRLLRQIGSGGMGNVFAAVHEGQGQQVALKLLKPDAAEDRQLAARFLQEGHALTNLQHPGVVRFITCERVNDGRVYLAMELLEGLSLRDWMHRHPGPVPMDTALALGRQIAETMDYVHARQIVHRDLKPENVFLCPHPGMAPGFQVKLLDFGIAKVPPAEPGARLDTQVQTVGPIILGSSTYMAPEQCRNAAAADGKADVYALGVLLFELLAGRPPFVSQDSVELITMHAREEPPSLRDLVPAVPGKLSTFVASMLAKEPTERPSMARCRDMFGRAWADGPDECPVPGLSPFSEAQAELFFGRKTEIEGLLGLLAEARTGRRWVQIEGSSGVGKSSLVQAGLLPRLKERPPRDASPWRIVNFRPSDALRNLARALCTAYADTGFTQPLEALEEALRADPDALRAWVTDHTPRGEYLLLVLEQLEELFLLEEAERRHLEGLVTAALAAPDSPLRLLTTLRSDFNHRLEQLPLLARQLDAAARYALRPMEEAALAQVVHGMAQRAGLRLSQDLPERMVREAAGEGSRLPLLGHTLRGLWSLRGGTHVTHEHYERLGGVGGALARQAEQFLNSLDDEERECAKWILLELVQISRGAPAIRRPRTWHELRKAAGHEQRAEAVLHRLSGMRSAPTQEAEPLLRLIVPSGGPAPAQQRVDLVHETLLQRVPFLVQWIEDERVWRERLTDLEATAQGWKEAGCPTDGLSTGTLLAHYRELTGTRKVSDLVAQFLEAAQRLERRQARRQRAIGFASLVAVLAITFSALYAFREQARAETTLQNLLALIRSLTSEDWKLGRRAFTLEMRQQVLQETGMRLGQLPAEDRENPKVLLEIILNLHRQSDLAFLSMTLMEADSILEIAREAIQEGLHREPENPDLLFQLGLNHSKRGKVALARGLRSEARAHFLQAIELFQRPHPGHEPADHRRTSATSHAELADQDLESGDAVAALQGYNRAIPLLEQNSSLYDRSLLAETVGLRGQAAHLAGDLDAAENDFKQALDLGRDVHTASPGDTYYRWVLARLLVGLAKLRTGQGQWEAAAKLFQEAQNLGDALHQGEQVNKRYALVLGEALLGHEHLTRLRGDTSRATELLNKRCALMGAFVSADDKDVRFEPLRCAP